MEAKAGAMGTVSRAIAVLRVLAESDGPVTVSETAERLGLPASTTHRLLRLLVDEDVATHLPDSRQYDAGAELVRIARLIAARSDVARVALPFMEEVVESCGESCLLGLYRPHEHDMMFVAQVESPHSLRFHIPLNVPLPLIWGCSGRAILAYLSEEEIDRVFEIAEPAPVGGTPPPDPAEFKAKVLPAIRHRGYDFTRGEKIPDSIGIAAPVFSAERGVIGSLSVSIPKTRFKTNSQGELGALLSGTARGLSAALGSTA